MIKFGIEMCDIQRREGRYFVFEQPQGSRALDLESVKKMAMRQDVEISTMHQCMSGAEGQRCSGRGTRLQAHKDDVEPRGFDGSVVTTV